MMSEIGSAQTLHLGRVSAFVAERYELLRELGRGGMGSVYEARHTWTGRKVALKTLLSHLAGDPNAVERFRREARAGVVGAHPNIAEVLDMGVDPLDGTLYLALELLDGEDLARRLVRETSLTPAEALPLLVPAMMALDAAHRAGVIHRDIKPANLFLARGVDGPTRLKVIDFGIANLADAAPVTRSGTPMGTPQYMAPEQVRGESNLDARADVWSMGVVCFEVLAGRRPFDGTRYHDVLAQVLTTRAPSLRSVAPHLDSDLCDVIDRALEPARSQRHPTMAAMAAALAALPAYAAEPWAVALRNTASSRPVPETRSSGELGPSTLELPEGEGSVSAGVVSEQGVSEKAVRSPETVMLATPPGVPTSLPVSMVRRDWRGSLALAVGVALVLGVSLRVMRGRPQTTVAARPPQGVVTTAPPAVLPVPQAPVPTLATAPVPAPVVVPTAPASPTAAPQARRGVSAGIRRALVRRPVREEPIREAPVNGAPVLEP